MKSVKYFLVLFLAFNILGCDSSDNEPIFVLSKANLIGTYSMESMTLNTKTTTEVVSGFPFVVNANSVGSLFQVDLIFNSDDTYSIKGEYAVKTTTTSIGSSPIVNEQIIVIDEAGTYAVDNSDGTISFTNQNAELLTGKLTVSGISETKLLLTQFVEEAIPSLNTTIEADLKISFNK
ncbi:hypothetical protein [Polaribacter septentrionalilitoris]|uniref:hypothetical protein n=1 Tax=Polaribacter septentrionalilitoris TaxID=2494657 RepID=UPI00135A8D2F|nr:hypothetical protein [Polaribacter septentrionalilitoris]